ncbi:uncharacterized protein LY79DRAFT_584230 [Colletotrichum navitas]|uniref:Uncharacterized protein n=1 Tax=Colletotrichum navitas TaxID=681940 RepID=A0AAD8UYI1_9PEZI|nr:uncharacterized protein LY79DRAFT_584230 [Colletotrichum navitas]KAK1570151.1 hypothetical protein LY79DRAFT_584230 [Colletotrichum navitas]
MATFIAMTRESARRIDRTRLPNDPAGKDFVWHWNEKDKMWEIKVKENFPGPKVLIVPTRITALRKMTYIFLLCNSFMHLNIFVPCVILTLSEYYIHSHTAIHNTTSFYYLDNHQRHLDVSETPILRGSNNFDSLSSPAFSLPYANQNAEAQQPPASPPRPASASFIASVRKAPQKLSVMYATHGTSHLSAAATIVTPSTDHEAG